MKERERRGARDWRRELRRQATVSTMHGMTRGPNVQRVDEPGSTAAKRTEKKDELEERNDVETKGGKGE